jgi:Fe2+ or Zn2+ uptake regulation protein
MRRNTAQRTIILETLRKAKSHPSVDWLYDEVRKVLPHISLGTVYRNLNILREEGLIQELIITGNKTYYEGNIEPHAHFICQQCGQILDVDFPKGNLIKGLINDGFDVKQLRLEYFGLCPDCRLQSKQQE